MRTGCAVLAVAGVASCATLRGIVQPPNLSQATERESQLRLLGPSSEHPLGAVALRVWARVENPNSFGLNLTSVAGDLHLEGSRAARFDFPLGLPLLATQDTVVPLELAIGLADLPGLAEVAQRALGTGTIDYRMEGIVSVDAGPFGQPSFGPQTLMRGELRVLR